MKSAEIVVTEAYAYVFSKHSFPQKVFVVGKRPIERRSWGSNTATIAIARRHGYQDLPENPDEGDWRIEWVRPQQILRMWAEQEPLNVVAQINAEAEMQRRRDRREHYTARLEALPPALLEILDIKDDHWRSNALKSGGSTSVAIDVPMLEALAALIEQDPF